jgi:hypothetical protein
MAVPTNQEVAQPLAIAFTPVLIVDSVAGPTWAVQMTLSTAAGLSASLIMSCPNAREVGSQMRAAALEASTKIIPAGGIIAQG